MANFEKSQFIKEPGKKLRNPNLRPPISEIKEDFIIERLIDPKFLPTYEQIVKTCGKKYDRYNSVTGQAFFKNETKIPIHEFLNEEYLNLFSDYLSQRAEIFGASENSPITILEVGAGNGKLSHFLQQKLETKIPGKFKIIATDSGGWELKTAFPVEMINHEKAIEKYKPTIIICSWMAPGVDLTKDFRANKKTDEYILIGDPDCCGEDWETYGNACDDHDEEIENPPYSSEGFTRDELYEMNKFQIGCSDFLIDLDLNNSKNFTHHSRTYSFKRINNK